MQKLSIIIPAYNEERTLREIINKIKAVHYPSVLKEIIVIDNNSTDGTFAVAKSIPDIRVIKELVQGKGAAVKRGFREAVGDFVIIQDADLEYDPNDYPAVVEPLLRGKTQAVLSIRTYFDSESARRGLFYKLGNSTITFATNLLYGGKAAEYTGGYKAFTKKLVDSITVNSNNFAYEHELVCKILKKGHTTIDVPIHYTRRDNRGGKKINWRDGFKILWAVIKYRFVD